MRRAAIGVLAIVIVATLSVGYFVFQPPNTVQIMISGVILNVEIARTPADQERGLSGRYSMPADDGMLFIFDNEAYWSFWMHGMQFPLDIIWFNSTRRAVFIEQNLQPCSPEVCQTFAPSAKAMYVLEVNAGFVAAHKISLGDMFAFVLG